MTTPRLVLTVILAPALLAAPFGAEPQNADKALGLTIRPSLLSRADRVIERGGSRPEQQARMR